MRKTIKTTIRHNLTLDGLITWLTSFTANLQANLPDTGRDEYFSHDVYVTLHTCSPAIYDIKPALTAPHDLLTIMDKLKCSARPKATNKLADFWRKARMSKWVLTRRGWPHVFMYRRTPEGAQVALVTVKSHRGRQLTKHQHAVMLALAAYGVPCYRYDPDTGFDRIGMGTPDAPTLIPPPPPPAQVQSQATPQQNATSSNLTLNKSTP